MVPEEQVPPAGHRLQELQEELSRLRQEERQVQEQITRLQAEMSRSQGQGRRRAQVNRSSALPALQMQQRRLRAELFRVEQEIHAWREQHEQKE